MKKILLLLVVVSILIYWGSNNQYAEDQAGDKNDGATEEMNYAPGEIIVKFKPTATALWNTAGDIKTGVTAEAANVGVNAELKKSFSFIAAHHIKLIDKNMTIQEAIAKLQTNPNVEYAEPNYIYRTTATPNDPRFGELWGLNNTGQSGGTVDADIDALEIWEIITGSTNVVVAVIDTGVDYTHLDLAVNMWINPGETPGNGIDDDDNGYVDDVYGMNAVNNSGDPMDDKNHGTHCSGTIGGVGNNAIGVVGVNHQVKIMALKFLDYSGSGTTDGAIECINYMIDMKKRGVNVKVASNSWGGGGYVQSLYDAIAEARDNDILFVAAAGNGGSDGIGDNNDSIPFYPASYNLANIISVAATNRNDIRSNFSNYGATSVDLAAPGEAILSSVPRNGYSPKASDLFFDDMESGSANWTAQSPWEITEEQNHTVGGSHAWSDSPSANYGNNINKAITSNVVINLSSMTTGTLMLGFWIRGQIQTDVDFLYVEVSRDGGTNWYPIGSPGTSSDTISNSAWGRKCYIISQFYRTANFKFRFRLVTNGSTVYGGVYIDDVGIGFADVGENIYSSFNGTSMATPHVAGVAGLILAAQPAYSYQQVKDRILNNVDPKAGLSGMVATGGRLNAYNAIYGIMPPVLNPIGNKTVNENELLTFTISAIDPDSPTITYSMASNPTATGATLGSSTGVFNWTPNYDQAGIYTVTFTATANALTDCETITITVNNVDRPPVLTSPSNKSINENQSLTFTLSAYDSDDDIITYSMASTPTTTGATLDSSTGAFNWTPSYDQAGIYTVTFIVTSNSLSDSETISITVNNVDRPPVLTSPGNKSINGNQLLTFTLSATDPDVEDTITYSLNSTPPAAGAILNSSTGVFYWTPGSNQAGTYSVTFSAISNSLSDPKTISIEVISSGNGKSKKGKKCGLIGLEPLALICLISLLKRRKSSRTTLRNP